MVEAASQGWADIAERRLEDLEEAQEEINKLRSSLEHSDRLIHGKNQEINKLRSDLAAASGEVENLENQLAEIFEPAAQDAEIQNLKSQIEWLESELADRERAPAENSAAVGKDLPEAADLLNQLKAKRKKSSVTLADVEKILEIIEEDGNE